MKGLIPFLKKGDLSEQLQRLVDIVGFEKTVEISQAFAGEYIYVTTVRCATMKARNRKIRKEFTGNNYGQLARRYELTEIQIRSIIHKRQKQKRA